MAQFGVAGPLEQLYQVGTVPPHLNYFSPRSLRLLLESCGLSLVEMTGDLDFEPNLLPDRVHFLRNRPAPVKRLLSQTILLLSHLLPGRDSAICVCRKSDPL